MGAFSNRLHYAAPHIGAMLASVPGYFGYVAIRLCQTKQLVDDLVDRPGSVDIYRSVQLFARPD